MQPKLFLLRSLLCIVVRTILVVGMADLLEVAKGDDRPNASESPAPGLLLKQLQDRDRLLDDLLVKYVKVRYETLDMYKIVFRELRTIGRKREDVFGESLSELLNDLKTPVSAQYRCEELMAVRGSTVGFEHNAEVVKTANDESHQWLMRHPEVASLIQGRSAERWSNSEGIGRSTNEESNPPYLAVTTTPGSLSLIDQQVMKVRFALGFGYGNRLIKISRIDPEADGTLTVVGTIRVWIDDESHCKLSLDKDRIVRSADIQSNVAGNLHEFTTTTVGTLEIPSTPSIAGSGTFIKKWLGTLKDGKTIGEPKVIEHFEVEDVSSAKPIPNDEFIRLTTFEIGDRTVVRDISKDITLSAGKTSLEGLLKYTYARIVVIVVNLVFIMFAIYYIHKKRRGVDK